MQKYLPQLQKAAGILRRYLVLICIVGFGTMYGFLIMTAGKQAELEPSQSQIQNAYKKVARPKIDESAANKLRELESRNIEIQSIFEQARNNPFSE